MKTYTYCSETQTIRQEPTLPFPANNYASQSDYINHILSLPVYPVEFIGGVIWDDGDELTESDFTIKNGKAFPVTHYEKVRDFLKSTYRTALIKIGNNPIAVQVDCNSMVIDKHVDYIKSVLAGQGFRVTAFRNMDMIEIK